MKQLIILLLMMWIFLSSCGPKTNDLPIRVVGPNIDVHCEEMDPQRRIAHNCYFSNSTKEPGTFFAKNVYLSPFDIWSEK